MPDSLIVDAQLHEPAVTLAWDYADDAMRAELMLEVQLAIMDAVGVDCAVLFPLRSSWGEMAASRFPERFRTVPMITAPGGLNGVPATAPDISDRVRDLARTPGVAAIRLLATAPDAEGRRVQAEPGVFDRAVAACADEGLPLFITTPGNLELAAAFAREHPSLRIVVDHLGLTQPPMYVPESLPFRSLEELLDLSDLPNVFVKATAVPTLSREAFPFGDVLPHLRSVMDAFGAERMMWGSDISRVTGRCGFELRFARAQTPYQGRHDYAEALFYLRETDAFSAQEKEWILGRTVQTLLGWPDPAVS